MMRRTKDDHQGIMSADIIAYDTETNTFGNFCGETEKLLPLPWDLNNPFVINPRKNHQKALSNNI